MFDLSWSLLGLVPGSQMHLRRIWWGSLLVLLALLLAGAFAPETGELAVTLPAASDFLFTDDSLGTPHFDATGDHVVWTRSRGNRWSLLRAKSDDLENPSELLSLDWS